RAACEAVAPQARTVPDPGQTAARLLARFGGARYGSDRRRRRTGPDAVHASLGLQDLDFDLAEIDLHRRARVQLQRENPAQPLGIVQIGSLDAVQFEINMIALAAQLEIVPVLQFDDFLGFALPAVDQDAALLEASFFVDTAPITVLRHVGLIAPDRPL